jgi:hypothetical protein
MYIADMAREVPFDCAKNAPLRARYPDCAKNAPLRARRFVLERLPGYLCDSCGGINLLQDIINL